MREATHTVGFFYLIEHGISPQLISRLLSLTAEFFALPFEAKQRIDINNGPYFRGYSRVGGELTNGKVDWREQIDFGPEALALPDPQGPEWLRGPNQWPDEIPNMAATVLKYQEQLTRISLDLLRWVGGVVGIPAECLRSGFCIRPGLVDEAGSLPESSTASRR
ncbi:2-oxoglutarate and iron-dependent oxygenase domain-containing protein [Rhodococcus globerulus]|uniref:2-oxoglutarate and iron-dependent oxygenase domain-containing protein n=1 Tax=Rhodococcus globerulus TaxID=33008 RepID=A0ABU4C4V9_RHOGO|nr:2-oxoglutarate and iron-dependent oxygenase domain-containing protein [Rhodococcus globerulus]MDV6271544.1 2-oxoglutarate and iron-dependent oxygenase domain-containing protein [Rhodococcus globerulus]